MPKSFWLSSREERRESDATLLYEKGKAIRFDIGFIGKGNSEISLDKVTRFERMAEVQNEKFYFATLIIVDMLGTKSRVPTLAAKMDGKIIQMAGSYWIREVAMHIKAVSPDFEHPILSQADPDLETYLTSALQDVDVLSFLRVAVAELAAEPSTPLAPVDEDDEDL